MFRRFLPQFLKKDSLEKPIGRWFRDSCEIKIARKVDLTNEDHCGPCGQYSKVHIEVPVSNVESFQQIEKIVLK